MYWGGVKRSLHPQISIVSQDETTLSYFRDIINYFSEKEAAHASYFDAELPLFELLFQRSRMTVNTTRSLGEFLDNLS